MRSLSVVIGIIVTAATATAQTAQPYSGEVVMTSTGTLGASWKEGRACTAHETCQTIIYNRKTGEIARFGDQWASDFVGTGNGKEVWRAETAAAKAIRLKDN
jgi:hypothetical protein